MTVIIIILGNRDAAPESSKEQAKEKFRYPYVGGVGMSTLVQGVSIGRMARRLQNSKSKNKRTNKTVGRIRNNRGDYLLCVENAQTKAWSDGNETETEAQVLSWERIGVQWVMGNPR